ncbi:MAG TPA: hypothetical protein VHH11_15650 [Gammaproteobacteria bacterium]|nr:hypothetical protein [Gammaproteobacteria bacterium]
MALQLMGMAAAVGPAATGATAATGAPGVYGAGWRESLACAGCAVVGVTAIANGAAEAAAITLLVGGPAAVAIVTGVGTCIGVCTAALK